MVKTVPNATPNANANTICPYSTSLVAFPHVQRVEPMHFGSVELVEQHGSTRSSELARPVKRVELCQNGMSQVEFGLYLTPTLTQTQTLSLTWKLKASIYLNDVKYAINCSTLIAYN